MNLNLKEGDNYKEDKMNESQKGNKVELNFTEPELN